MLVRILGRCVVVGLRQRMCLRALSRHCIPSVGLAQARTPRARPGLARVASARRYGRIQRNEAPIGEENVVVASDSLGSVQSIAPELSVP